MKSIDINERTDRQERSALTQTCAVVRIEAICFGLVLFSALTVNAVQFIETCEIDICRFLAIASMPVSSVAIGIIVGFVIRLFREIENSDTPFKYSIADKIKALAQAVLGGTTAIAILLGAIQLLYSLLSNAPVSLTFAGVIGIGGLFIGAILMAFSRVFAVGCRLQQESDETL